MDRHPLVDGDGSASARPGALPQCFHLPGLVRDFRLLAFHSGKRLAVAVLREPVRGLRGLNASFDMSPAASTPSGRFSFTRLHSSDRSLGVNTLFGKGCCRTTTTVERRSSLRNSRREMPREQRVQRDRKERSDRGLRHKLMPSKRREKGLQMERSRTFLAACHAKKVVAGCRSRGKSPSRSGERGYSSSSSSAVAGGGSAGQTICDRCPPCFSPWSGDLSTDRPPTARRDRTPSGLSYRGSHSQLVFRRHPLPLTVKMKSSCRPENFPTQPVSFSSRRCNLAIARWLGVSCPFRQQFY